MMPRLIEPYLSRIKASPIGYRLAHGAFWSLAGAVISRGLTLVALIVVSKLLGQIEFGKLGIIQSTVGLFQIFAGFGLGLMATKYVAEYRKTDPGKAGRILGLSWLISAISGFAFTLVVLIFAAIIAEHALAAPEIANLLRIGSIIIFLGALNGTQTGALAGFEAFRTIAKINFFAGLLSFPLMIIGAYAGNLAGAVWGLCASMGVNWLLNHIAVRSCAKHSHVPILVWAGFDELKLVWSFGVPAFLSSVMFWPAIWISAAILVNQPNGYAEMGIFTAANQWRIAILFIPSAVASIVLPVLSDLHSQTAQAKYKKVLWYNIVFNIIVALAAAIPIGFLSRFIMATYGMDFIRGSDVLILLCIVAVLHSVSNVIGQAIASSGKMWWSFMLNLIWSCVLLGGTYILRANGAWGLAIANVIAYGILMLLSLAYMRYVLIQRPPQKIPDIQMNGQL